MKAGNDTNVASDAPVLEPVGADAGLPGRLGSMVRFLFGGAAAAPKLVPVATEPPPRAVPPDEILDALHDAVLELDGGGRVARANAAAETLFGAPLLGRRWSELVPGFDPGHAPQADRRSPRGTSLGACFAAEGRHLQGGVFPVELQMLGDDRVVIARDVSERQRALARLTKSNARLASALELARGQGAARTVELARLAVALREPVNAARTHAHQALRAASRDAVERDDLSAAASAVVVVERALEALIDVLQLDAGLVRPTVEPVDAVAAVRGVARRWAPMAGVRRCGLRVDAPSGPVVAAGDRARLEQILESVAEDAITRVDAAQVELVVDPWQGGARITVRAMRGPGAASSQPPTSSLELARCELIARRLRSELRIAHDPRGCTYVLELPPFDPSVDEPEPPTESLPPMMLETPAPAHRVRQEQGEDEEVSPVLVVWPDAGEAEIVVTELASRGWLVRAAPWDVEVVDEVARGRPAVVVLARASADGLDLCAALADDVGAARVPRIALTSEELGRLGWDGLHDRVGAEILAAAMRGLGA